MPDEETSDAVHSGMVSARSDSDEETTSTETGNVKDEWRGRYMYVPDEINESIDDEFNRLKYLGGTERNWEPEKNRHYYPVLVAVAMKEIESMDIEQFLEAVHEVADADEGVIDPSALPELDDE